jgi:hypothetical protein
MNGVGQSSALSLGSRVLLRHGFKPARLFLEMSCDEPRILNKIEFVPLLNI